MVRWILGGSASVTAPSSPKHTRLMKMPPTARSVGFRATTTIRSPSPEAPPMIKSALKSPRAPGASTESTAHESAAPGVTPPVSSAMAF